MKKSFTNPSKKIVFFIFTFIVLSLFSKSYAQITCENENMLFNDTFGTGITPTRSPDVTSLLSFQVSSVLAGEGKYRIINNTQQKPEWQNSEDHTAGDVNGKMLVVNAAGPADFYIHEISSNAFSTGNYIANFYVMNVDTSVTCGKNALLPDLALKVEYLSDANTWVPLDGSPFSVSPIVQTKTPTWVEAGATFSLPTTVTSVVKSLRIVLSDMTQGGCGNDFALDDIKVSFCPSGGATPVTLLNVTAHQKGSGVSVEWSTSQEINSSRFEIERNSDGNSNWIKVATTSAAGNSSVVKKYNAYDAKPLGGPNFYRLKQIDKDGVSKYSKTVRVNLSLAKTGVSVLTNPFHNLVTIDFSSSTSQSVSARLVDITGKQVAAEKWSIAIGNTRKELSNVNGLQQGMYILTVSDANGQVLYNNKVIKQ